MTIRIQSIITFLHRFYLVRVFELVARDADDHLADMFLTLKTLVRSKCIVKAEHAIHDGLQVMRGECAVHVLEPSVGKC